MTRVAQISQFDKGNVLSLLYNWRVDEVKVIVITDGSRVLGLGDLGINGMAISGTKKRKEKEEKTAIDPTDCFRFVCSFTVGKLALYVAAGGIRPEATLPIVIDVGTNNERLLRDPDYLGLRKRRVDEREYYEILDEIVWAIAQRWPHALVQFEDFSNARERIVID